MNNLELEKKATQKISKQLSQFLANTYVLYLKTQNFHWNVEDPRFFFLHKMLEEQYEELAEAVDLIAERIRSIGHRSPGSMQEFLKLATIKESLEELTANQMIEELLQDHESIAAHMRSLVEEFTKLGDQGSGDVLVERVRAHEKTAWMLRSHLKKGSYESNIS